MSTSLRNSGVDVLGEMPWGSHVCMFYESKDDLLDTVVPFSRPDGEQRVLPVGVLEPLKFEEARTELSRRIPAFDRHLAAGSMEIVPGREWYLEGDRFDLERITSGLEEKLRGALAKGYDGMRVSGNAFWLNSDQWNAFCEYERELNELLKGQPMTVLCTYPVGISGAAEVLEVAQAHQLAVARRKGDWTVVELVPAKVSRPSADAA